MEMSKSKAVSILGWALFSASWLLAVFITAYISIISEHVTGRLIDWSNLTFQGMIFYIIIILFIISFPVAIIYSIMKNIKLNK